MSPGGPRSNVSSGKANGRGTESEVATGLSNGEMNRWKEVTRTKKSNRRGAKPGPTTRRINQDEDYRTHDTEEEERPDPHGAGHTAGPEPLAARRLATGRRLDLLHGQLGRRRGGRQAGGRYLRDRHQRSYARMHPQGGHTGVKLQPR